MVALAFWIPTEITVSVERFKGQRSIYVGSVYAVFSALNEF